MQLVADVTWDLAGRSGVKFALLVALVAVPVCYPHKTLSVLKGAQMSWEQLWTIDGLRGRRA
jgi:hypothetical protein